MNCEMGEGRRRAYSLGEVRNARCVEDIPLLKATSKILGSFATARRVVDTEGSGWSREVAVRREGRVDSMEEDKSEVGALDANVGTGARLRRFRAPRPPMSLPRHSSIDST